MMTPLKKTAVGHLRKSMAAATKSFLRGDAVS